MKKILGFSLASVIALGGSVALAGAEVGSWYVAPTFQGVWVDNDRNADDSGGFSLAFGRTVLPNWDAELALNTSSHNQAAGAKLDLTGISMAAHRVFYRDSRFSPYLAIGLGWLQAKANSSSSDSRVTASYGLGLLADIAKHADKGTDLQARFEILGRRDLSSSATNRNPVDYLAGLGLQYSWGATIAPPPPADSDSDGVPDNMDKCPGTPAGATVNADGCEPVVDKDSDRDGREFGELNHWCSPSSAVRSTGVANRDRGGRSFGHANRTETAGYPSASFVGTPAADECTGGHCAASAHFSQGQVSIRDGTARPRPLAIVPCDIGHWLRSCFDCCDDGTAGETEQDHDSDRNELASRRGRNAHPAGRRGYGLCPGRPAWCPCR